MLSNFQKIFRARVVRTKKEVVYIVFFFFLIDSTKIPLKGNFIKENH